MGEKLKNFFVGMWADPKVKTAISALTGAVGLYLAQHFGLLGL